MVRLVAPAKLTWSLRLVGVRADGYHLIDAEMSTLDLADQLTLYEVGDEAVGDDAVGDKAAGEATSPRPVTSLTVGGPFADGVPTNDSNLVARAMRLVGRNAGVHIDKRIPNGGGLGGGSADAAAILRWAGVDDPAVAVQLGADVPFCVAGGRGRVTGIGEQVAPLPPRPTLVTLVVPPLHVSTAAVYRAWDELGGPTGDGPNDLEPAALVVERQLVAWRDRITEMAGVRPLLAGSGATWFVEGDQESVLGPLRRDGATVKVVRTLA